jgi:group I intron endonuclease
MDKRIFFPQLEKLSDEQMFMALAGSGVYVMLNLENGRSYVGMAGKTNFYQRWCMHLSALARGNHHSRKLQKDWNELKSPFSFQFIESCAPEEARARERLYIAKHNPYYNTLLGQPL